MLRLLFEVLPCVRQLFADIVADMLAATAQAGSNFVQQKAQSLSRHQSLLATNHRRIAMNN
jgi:hypothetical protein